MKCRSGKHEWRDPVSAERCCDPRWRRELRYGSERIEGDGEDGVTVAHGCGGMVYVWRRVEDTQ